jgi:hypothetical protein
VPIRTYKDQLAEERAARGEPKQGASLFWVGGLAVAWFLAWLFSQSPKLVPLGLLLITVYCVLGAVGLLPFPDAALHWLQNVWPYGR